MKYQVRYWRLENHTSRDAFYEVYLEGSTVAILYGKMHTVGRLDVTEYPDQEKAQATALRQVYAKQSKEYELIHNDLMVEVETALTEAAFTRIKHDIKSAMRSGHATPREQALNYIEGFISDCNEFLVRAKSGQSVEDEFEALDARWTELMDKVESAETMMDMVKRRALKRV